MAFVDEDAVRELYEAIAELERAVNAARYVDPVWRKRWKTFVARWRAEYSAYDELGDALDPAEGRARLDKFGDAWLTFKGHWESGIPQRAPSSTSSPRPATSSSGGGGAAALVLLGLLVLWGSK